MTKRQKMPYAERILWSDKTIQETGRRFNTSDFKYAVPKWI